MNYSGKELYELLPAVYRIRDLEQGEPLKALVEVIASQAQVLEKDILALYRNWFIETCDEWVVPYIGDMIGVRGLNTVENTDAFSNRARVADTIGFRRRKGTLTMLEQFARDAGNWPARAVEFFQQLATTQYINHIRIVNDRTPELPKQYINHIRLLNHRTPDLRDMGNLDKLGTAFNTIAHTSEVRRIAVERGRYNIPNIGIFLWRLKSQRVSNSPAVAVDANRFYFSPLGNNTPLFTNPVTEETVTHSAGPLNVPMPISRRMMADVIEDYYGTEKSIQIFRGGVLVPPGHIVVCNLSDLDPGADHAVGNVWAHTPDPGKVAIDPVLGRIAFADAPTDAVTVTFHYGFSADMGGGEYDRSASINARLQTRAVNATGIQAGLNALSGVSGAVEVTDNGRWQGAIDITLPSGYELELRSKNNIRPTLDLTNPVDGTAGSITIQGDGAEVTLNGLLIVGGNIVAKKGLKRLTLKHCTLVPGIYLGRDSTPMNHVLPSLTLDCDAADTVELIIDHSIVGSLQVTNGENATVTIRDSIVDALTQTGRAYSADGTIATGPSLTIKRSTVIGRVYATELYASDCIFDGVATMPDPPVLVERRQIGCVRFSSVPPGSRVPRPYRCQPQLAVQEHAAELGLSSVADMNPAEVRDITGRLAPQYTSRRYGQPGYMQLSAAIDDGLYRGASDGAEMGAFHDLFQPQRESNIRNGIPEYLRFGLEFGLFFAT